MLRRLYSTFAGGWPGTGLLLMRLVSGSALLARAVATFWSATPAHVTITSAVLAICGILLIPGLWTPLAGTLAASVEIWQILTRTGDPWVLLFLATIAAALAMLGPGLWSVDARLFGWKRVEVPARKRGSALL